MRILVALRFSFAFAAILVAACDDRAARGYDGGQDAAADAGTDGGADAGADGGMDAGTDGGAGDVDSGTEDTDSCGGEVVDSDFDFTDAGALAALVDVTHVAGSVTVSGAGIVDLSPLSSLRCVDGDLRVTDCPSLAHLDGLDGLVAIGGSLVVGWNGALSDADGLTALGGVGGSIWLTNNPALVTIDLPSLASLGSHFLVSECAAVTSIELPMLTAIGGDLELSYCGAITALSGLAALGTVGTGVFIEGNVALPTCEADDLVAQLDGFDGPQCIQGNAADVCPDVTSGCP